MRIVVVLAVVAACHFDHGAAARDDGDVSPDDVPIVDGLLLDGATDAPLVKPFCDTTDGTLVACYAFENNTQDGTNHNLDATMTNVSFPNGKVGKAMQFGATSAADVNENAMFDLDALTIEAWIFPTVLPAPGRRMGVFDNDGQYGLFLHENGRLQCTLTNGPSLGFDANIPANTWTHVACAYDGANSALYVNGVAVTKGNGGATLSTGGTTGISIAADNPPGAGSQLIGLIDQMRIYSVDRGEAAICRDAEATGCP